MAIRAITSSRWLNDFRPAPVRMSGITCASTEPHHHAHRHGRQVMLDAIPGEILEV